MYSALIVSAAQKSISSLLEMLKAAEITEISSLTTCSAARRRLMSRDYDLVIINSPLPDESGEELSRDIAQNGISQVILIASGERFDEISAACENDGVLTVAKPLNKTVFWSVLKLARSTYSRLRRMQAENNKLKQKVEDIKVVNRAKYLLISYFKMSEQDAHRYMEKQAMDMRRTKREVAEDILKKYGD